jgi:hypothetical protein
VRASAELLETTPRASRSSGTGSFFDALEKRRRREDSSPINKAHQNFVASIITTVVPKCVQAIRNIVFPSPTTTTTPSTKHCAVNHSSAEVYLCTEKLQYRKNSVQPPPFQNSALLLALHTHFSRTSRLLHTPPWLKLCKVVSMTGRVSATTKRLRGSGCGTRRGGKLQKHRPRSKNLIITFTHATKTG